MLPGGLKAPSVFHGSHYRAFLERFLPTDAWPDMVLPVHVNAVDLATGNQEWFGDGGRQDLNVLDAVYASSALPGVFPPVRSGDQSLIDGGFYQALPMDRSLETSATGILAIDVGSGPVADLDVIMDQGMVGIQQRASSIMIRENRMDLISRWNGLPTVLLRPNLDGYGNFDFDSVDYFLAEGYRAAKARLT